MRRPLVPVLLAVSLAVVAFVAFGRGGEPMHRVSVTIPDATNTVEGQYVRAGGENVGKIARITPVDNGRKVRLDLDIGDKAWPLTKGTKFLLRWGGTASYDNRFVAILPGPAGAPRLPDGAVLRPADFSVPVEFDSFLATFTPEVRTDLRRFIDNGGPALKRAKPGLVKALDATPPALREARRVMLDLTEDKAALDTLLRQTDQVVNAIQTADPGLQVLLTGAARTFTAVADRQTQLKQTLSQAPDTFARVRGTLARADGTLRSAAELTVKVDPGVGELRRIAAPLNRVLKTVVAVGPDARATLAIARAATPSLNPLLTKATAQLPQLRDIGEQSERELKCLRPYSPEIASFFSNWGDFLSQSDGRDKFIRANVLVPTPVLSNASPYNSAEALKLFPGTTFGFPRPPGEAAGQPWYLPECGLGQDTLDAAKDSETR